MYNRYRGNSGRRERVPEPGDLPPFAPPPPPGPPPPEPHPPEPPPPPPPEWSGTLARLLRRLSPAALETEDFLLLALLYLLYRESGDRDFLWMIAAYLFMT